MTNIVFLLGESFAGKDTVGKMFVGKGYTRVSFADALKYRYAAENNIDPKVLFEQGPEKEKHRLGLIQVAEDTKKVDPLIWLNEAFKPYRDEEGFFFDNLKLVVTDCRRICEVDWLRDQKRLEELWNVNYPDKPVTRTLILSIERPGNNDPDVLTHQAIGYAKGISRVTPFIDNVINNNSTLESLQNRVDSLFPIHLLFKVGTDGMNGTEVLTFARELRERLQ